MSFDLGGILTAGISDWASGNTAGALTGGGADWLGAGNNLAAPLTANTASTTSSTGTPDTGTLVANFIKNFPGYQKDLDAVGGDPNAFATWFQQQYATGMFSGTSGSFGPEAQLNSALTTNGVTAAGTSVPIEQNLLQQALPELQGEISSDAATSAQIDTIQKQLGVDYGTAQQYLQNIMNGTQLAGQNANADTLGAALSSAAGTSAAAQQGNLQTEIAGLNAAQDPLNAARVAAAQTQASTINQGLQTTEDQLAAQNAAKGYTGTSSMEDAALLRATIGARQQAAGALSGANVTNATDTAGIAAQGATGQNTIANALATANQNAANTTAQGKATYYDANTQAALAAALQSPQLDTGLATSTATLNGLRTQGLNNALNTLSWWNTGTTQPNISYAPVTASQSGSDISALGSALLGGSMKVGSANNWWSTPSTGPSTGAGSTPGTTPTGQLVN